MVEERCTHSCTASRRTDFADMVGNIPWEADSPARLAARRPGEVQARLAAVVAAAAAAAVAVVVVAAAVAEAQANLSHHRAAHCVHQTRQSAVGYMSHKSSRSRATDSPHALCRAE
jgi:hypothetical protein